MKKLKTLKDIFKGVYTQESRLFEMVLRAEAIKWVKDLTEKQKTSLRGGIKYNNFAIIEWIKHFFNLTEEDLK